MDNLPSGKELEAQILLERAEKKAKSFSFFGMNKTQNYEDAADMCSKAGNLLKIEKKWKEAGDAYMKSAEYLSQTDEKDEIVNKYLDAAKCFKKSNPADSVKVMLLAIDLLKEKGRFSTAATHIKAVAETFESDLVDIEQATKYYEEAGELYQAEDASGQANQCFLKVAAFAAQLEQYDKSIQRFEQVATSSLDSPLTKYSVKLYFLNSGLVHILKDYVGAQRAIEKYGDLDVTFSQTREGIFLKDLLAAFEEGDSVKFSTVVAEFDRMTKLDAWKTTILLRIKKQIAEEPSLT